MKNYYSVCIVNYGGGIKSNEITFEANSIALAKRHATQLYNKGALHINGFEDMQDALFLRSIAKDSKDQSAYNDCFSRQIYPRLKRWDH